MGLPLECYRQVIASWFELHLRTHQVACDWWSHHDKSWPHQQAAFKYDNPADGLELWAMSVALGLHVMVVLESSLWSTWPSGFEHQDSVILCGMDGAILCEWELQEDQDTSNETVGALLDFPEEESLPSGAVGHPRVTEHLRLSAKEAASVREANDSSMGESDLDNLI